jgi:hypothetical protein
MLPIQGKFDLASDARGYPEWRISTDYLLTEVIGLAKERQNNNHTKRLSAVMRALGWTRREQTMRIGTIAVRGYFRLKAQEGGIDEVVTGVTPRDTEKRGLLSLQLIHSSTSDVTPVTPVTKKVGITRRV